MHPALESIFESSLPASTGVDLGLNDELTTRESQSQGDVLGFLGRRGHLPGLCGNAEFGEKFPSLKFVDIHEV